MKQPTDPKEQFLQAVGGIYPHPQEVRDPQFQQQGFFDPRDGLQVRYEMLRRHRAEGHSVAATARAFGISRQHFYQLAQAFEQRGLYGLLPQKRGPHAPYKCTAAIMEYVEARRREAPPLCWDELARQVEQVFGLRLHPRTLERRWTAGQKKTTSPRTIPEATLIGAHAAGRYEQLRRFADGEVRPTIAEQHELEVLRWRGMAGWLRWAAALEPPAPIHEQSAEAPETDPAPRDGRTRNQEKVAVLTTLILECLEVKHESSGENQPGPSAPQGLPLHSPVQSLSDRTQSGKHPASV